MLILFRSNEKIFYAHIYDIKMYADHYINKLILILLKSFSLQSVDINECIMHIALLSKKKSKFEKH